MNPARGLLAATRRLRFAIWAARARARVRRFGGRLVIEAAAGVSFDRPPRLRAFPDGEGGGVTRLRFGRNVQLGSDTTIEVWARANNTLELGDQTRLLHGVRLILRGGAARFGDRCLLRDGAWLKVAGELTAADDVVISQNATIHCAERVDLGAGVGLAERVSIVDIDHPHGADETHFMEREATTAPVRIEANSQVLAGAVILPGTTLGPGSKVGANAVVRPGTYEAGSLIAAVPARLAGRAPE